MFMLSEQQAQHLDTHAQMDMDMEQDGDGG